MPYILGMIPALCLLVAFCLGLVIGHLIKIPIISQNPPIPTTSNATSAKAYQPTVMGRKKSVTLLTPEHTENVLKRQKDG